MRFIIALAFLFGVATAATAQSNRQPQPVPQRTQEQTAAAQRGTDSSPLVVRVLPTPKTAEEAAQDQKQRDDESSANWWMVRLTGVIAFIGLIQAAVFWIQAGRLKQTIDKMDEIATGQTSDMRESIAQWKRVAAAMEGVSTAMGTNVSLLGETNKTAAATAATSKRIADRQEIIGELQTRAYLAVGYLGLVPQNNQTLYRFEPRMTLNSTGLTPAYRVRYRAVCEFLPFPLPEDFAFPLPDVPAQGTGMLGPRNGFTISAAANRMFSDLEIQEMKAGTTRRLYMYGTVDYDDAFGKPRYLKFSQSIVWYADGVTTIGFNTTNHNDGD